MWKHVEAGDGTRVLELGAQHFDQLSYLDGPWFWCFEAVCTCSPGWLRTHYVAKVDLELWNLCLHFPVVCESHHTWPACILIDIVKLVCKRGLVIHTSLPHPQTLWVIQTRSVSLEELASNFTSWLVKLSVFPHPGAQEHLLCSQLLVLHLDHIFKYSFPHQPMEILYIVPLHCSQFYCGYSSLQLDFQFYDGLCFLWCKMSF